VNEDSQEELSTTVPTCIGVKLVSTSRVEGAKAPLAAGKRVWTMVSSAVGGEGHPFSTVLLRVSLESEA
jgi:hypothetical protein